MSNKRNVFYTYYNMHRWVFLIAGQWPYQSNVQKIFLRLYQIIISGVLLKGQVSFNIFVLKKSTFKYDLSSSVKLWNHRNNYFIEVNNKYTNGKLK